LEWERRKGTMFRLLPGIFDIVPPQIGEGKAQPQKTRVGNREE
jgi:hypothetical protein